MRKIGFSVGAVFVALVILIVAAMFALETRWFSDYLSGKLSDSLGREVEWAGPLKIDWSLSPQVQVEQPRVANADWAEHDSITEAESASVRVDLTAVFDGLLVVEQLELEKPVVHLAQSPTEGSNWGFLISEEEKEEPLLEPRVGSILIRDGEFTFLAPEQDTSVAVKINAPDGEQIEVDGDGQLLGRPIMLSLSGGPPGKAASQVMSDEDVIDHYRIAGQLGWQGHLARVDGYTESLTEIGDVQLDVSLEGPDANAIVELFGYSTSKSPYFINGSVQHQQQRWSLNNLMGELGDSEIDGQLAFDQSGDRPLIMADLDVSALDVDETLPFLLKGEKQQEETQQKQPWRQQIKQQVTLLNSFDADVRVDLDRLSFKDSAWRNITGNAQLKSGELQIEPLAFEVEKGRVVANAQVETSGDAPTGDASVALQSLDLGQTLSAVGFGQLGSIDGRLSVSLQDQVVMLSDSKLHYWDEQNNTAVTLDVNSDQTESGGPAMAATLSGQVRNEAVSGDYFSGPLLSLVARPEPTPIRLDASLADNEFHVNGTVTSPLRLQGVDLKVSAKGPGTETLSQVAPIQLPQLPAYDIEGQFVREDDSWYLRDTNANLGSSDVSGDIRFELPAEATPTMWATLHSDTLSSADFVPGGGTSEGSSEEQEQAESEQSEGSEDVLPEGEVLQKYMQVLEADIQYTAEELKLAGIAFDQTELNLSLYDGKLSLEPLSLGVDPGSIELQFHLDAGTMPAEGDADIEITQVNLKNLLEGFELADRTLGILGGRGQFSFTGNSLADALAALEGELRLMMDGGQINALVVEALGLDAGELLVDLIGDDPEPVDIQCAYAELDAEEGTVDIAHFTVATTDSNIQGNGSVDLGEEEFQLVIEANPKDFSLLSGSSPIELSGTFRNLNVDVVSEELLGKGALSAVAAAAFPPAALAPLVETGTTSGTGGCNDMVASME